MGSTTPAEHLPLLLLLWLLLLPWDTQVTGPASVFHAMDYGKQCHILRTSSFLAWSVLLTKAWRTENPGIGISRSETEPCLSQCGGVNSVLREEALGTVRELRFLLTEDNH